MVLVLPCQKKLHTKDVGSVISHGHFHDWIGQQTKIKPGPPHEDRYQWWPEGFTEYDGLSFALQQNTLSACGAWDLLNRRLMPYYLYGHEKIHPLHTLWNQECQFFPGQAFSCAKGLVFALSLDGWGRPLYPWADHPPRFYEGPFFKAPSKQAPLVNTMVNTLIRIMVRAPSSFCLRQSVRARNGCLLFPRVLAVPCDLYSPRSAHHLQPTALFVNVADDAYCHA